MSDERFSEEDLAPSAEERRAVLLSRIDRSATALAVLSVGIVIGGMVALGACAAPFVFSLTPAPANGTAMGAAFARFDRIAIAGSVLLLAAEMIRTFLGRKSRRDASSRVRRLLAVAFAACTSYAGLAITPAINGLHQSGVVRGEGVQGEQLDAIHKKAEFLGKAELVIGALLIGLHVFTVRAANEEETDFEAPLPPGPQD